MSYCPQLDYSSPVHTDAIQKFFLLEYQFHVLYSDNIYALGPFLGLPSNIQHIPAFQVCEVLDTMYLPSFADDGHSAVRFPSQAHTHTYHVHLIIEEQE